MEKNKPVVNLIFKRRDRHTRKIKYWFIAAMYIYSFQQHFDRLSTEPDSQKTSIKQDLEATTAQ